MVKLLAYTQAYGARLAHVVGSNPTGGTNMFCDFSIEVVPRTHNSYRTGSNPVARTIYYEKEVY